MKHQRFIEDDHRKDTFRYGRAVGLEKIMGDIVKEDLSIGVGQFHLVRRTPATGHLAVGIIDDNPVFSIRKGVHHKDSCGCSDGWFLDLSVLTGIERQGERNQRAIRRPGECAGIKVPAWLKAKAVFFSTGVEVLEHEVQAALFHISQAGFIWRKRNETGYHRQFLPDLTGLDVYTPEVRAVGGEGFAAIKGLHVGVIEGAAVL